MLAYRYPVIAREGWTWIFLAVMVAIAGHLVFSWLALPLWLIVLLFLFLYRDPARSIPASPLGVVSPVDGEVLRVESIRDEYCDRTAICISIGMTITSVYTMHSPIEGKIIQQWHGVPSKIRFKEDTDRPNTFAQWIQSDEADDVVLVAERGMIAFRPQCYAHSGERIGQGQRCGYIRFGATVHVLVPESTRISVAAGDQVHAGSDIIATLVHAKISSPQDEAA